MARSVIILKLKLQNNMKTIEVNSVTCVAKVHVNAIVGKVLGQISIMI